VYELWLRWFGDVLRRGDGKKADGDDGRERERPKRCWSDCTVEDLNSIGVGENAQDRAIWRKRVRTGDPTTPAQRQPVKEDERHKYGACYGVVLSCVWLPLTLLSSECTPCSSLILDLPLWSVSVIWPLNDTILSIFWESKSISSSIFLKSFFIWMRRGNIKAVVLNGGLKGHWPTILLTILNYHALLRMQIE